MIDILRAGMLLQLRLIREYRDYALELVRTPLLAAVFLLVVLHSGRPGLIVNAVVAPVLVGWWGMGLSISGEIVDTDRVLGLLEPTIATPAPFPVLVLGRTLGTTVVSGLCAVEVWLVATVVFGVTVPMHHPVVFAAAALVTIAAMNGTSLLMAALFVATRTARTFQNSLSYPFLLLGGVFVPVAQLPGWTHIPARLTFLSWSADLLRGSLAPGPVGQAGYRLLVILALGGLNAAAGLLVLRRVLRRARANGSLGLT
jgi:ABC-2 type transport system permease protein